MTYVGLAFVALEPVYTSMQSTLVFIIFILFEIIKVSA
jgi:hypothetical protein